MPLLFHSRKAKPTWDELRKATDPELLAQLRSGNDDAFAVIVDRYRRLVFSVALRIVKHESEAEDVGQTVFVEIYKNAAQFDASRWILKTWVLQYAYSRSINRRQYLEHRQFYSQPALDQVEPLRLPLDAAPLHGLSSDEAGILVRQALGSLNEDQRTAIELVYLHGLTMEEAAGKQVQSRSLDLRS